MKQLYERFGDQISVYPQFSQFTDRGRSAGPSGRAFELSRGQAGSELSAPAGRPDDATGRTSRARAARGRRPSAPADAMIETASQTTGSRPSRWSTKGSRMLFPLDRTGAFCAFCLLAVMPSAATASQNFFRQGLADPPAQEVTPNFCSASRVGSSRARGRPGRFISPAVCTRGYTSPGRGSSAIWARSGSRS